MDVDVRIGSGENSGQVVDIHNQRFDSRGKHLVPRVKGSVQLQVTNSILVNT